MDCYPPCVTCTGLCQTTRWEHLTKRTNHSARPRRVTPVSAKGTLLSCGHPCDLDNPTLTVLGDGLGAKPWCDRCGDFVSVRKPGRKRKSPLPVVPMF